MTEGIIQKVFRKEINFYISENNRYMLDALTNIQTELISEIENNLHAFAIPSNTFQAQQTKQDIIRQLIGDNKE